MTDHMTENNALKIVMMLLAFISLLACAKDEHKPNAQESAADSRSFKNCDICPEMVIIPAGSFDMGTNNGASDEIPVHRVSIGRDFALAKTEVTQGQWKAVMGDNPSFFKKCGDNCPVENVSWNDVQEFIKKLNATTGKRFRLPTEAEWEYACYGGSQTKYCGSGNLDSMAWGNQNSGGKTHPVAQKLSNAFGLYDMTGNVWEWVEDCYHDSYNGAPSDGSAWTRKCSEDRRMIRGSSWGIDPLSAYAARHLRFGAASIGNVSGFRLARTLP